MPAWTMFAKIALSVAVGFLGAYPLASSSGLMATPWAGNDSSRNSLIVSSGLILFFLVLSSIGPAIRLVSRAFDTLERVEERPNTMVALTMLTLGSICAISAMGIQLNAGNVPHPSLSMNLNGFTTAPQVSTPSGGSFSLGVLTILTFLLGSSLIGLGIWASIKPSRRTLVSAGKPESREFAEVAS